MTDYLSIDGVIGPVTTSPYVGTFECFYLTSGVPGQGPKTMYTSINAERCRPALMSLCAAGKAINKIVFTSVSNGSLQPYVSFWVGAIITTVYPKTYPSGNSYLNFAVDMEFSYTSTVLHPITQVQLFRLPNLLVRPAG